MEAYCCYKRKEFLIAKIGNSTNKQNLLPYISMEIGAASSHLLVEVNIYMYISFANWKSRLGFGGKWGGGGEGGGGRAETSHVCRGQVLQ
jgi:hypothetical protein